MNTKRAPKVRFKGFTDAWEQRKLEALVDVCSGRDYKHLTEGDIPVYGTGGYMLSVSEALSYDKDAIGIGRKGTIDKPYILNAPFWTVDTLFYAIPKEKVDLNFAFAIFQNINWKKKDESTGVPSLSRTAINEIHILVPQYDEQQALGQLFYGIDRLITLHQRKLDKTKKLKKAFLNLIFGQKLRFRGFTDSWELRKLEEISNKVIERNKDCKYTETFTNSAELGIISQRDFFDKDISNNENMNGYYVVRNGDFVYNPRVSTSAPVGPIKRNNLGRTGIMSPLYYIFHTHDIVDGRYLEYYFSSTKWHKFMKQNGDSGVRSDRLAIKDTTFIKMIIPIPSKMKEQRKVGIFFKLLDDTIILRQEKINQLIKLKTIFLKNMFI
ncbi:MULTISPECIES: restriction endonuclease subunit S [Phascolarctobacterium]|nr:MULTISPECIES: restriction endonuclease subunit S [Phascolarctobacterium]MBS6905133.1 restriction endonuclease subunit S [Phascolarctobacterium sp.]